MTFISLEMPPKISERHNTSRFVDTTIQGVKTTPNSNLIINPYLKASEMRRNACRQSTIDG